jgi:RHH-type transcriptional regulator, rel operon repressor / antitoxin RelB
MMSTISLRLNKKDDALIRKYAQLHNIELSTFIRQTIIEKIEDEYDLTLFNKVWQEEQNQERMSHDEVKKELDL